jgi:sugar phosphate isomerase/epimerase
MSFPRSSLETIPFSYASVSVGTPNDPLEKKLAAISRAGFKGIELGFPDLQSFASKHFGKEIKENEYESLCKAGQEVKALCEKYKLRIMMLQPFSNFEGWAKGSKEREDAFSRAKGWIKIMEAVGTDMLQVSTSLPSSSFPKLTKQVGSSDSPNITSSQDKLALDLAELADLLAPHNFRLAYENWCWATHATTWSDVWNIVQKADRPNIGLCLDTFRASPFLFPSNPS